MLNIRNETLSDYGVIRSLITDAFGQTDEARLVDALHQAGTLSYSLVVKLNGAIVGHIALSRLRVPANCLALAPVSVRPDRQGRGIGSALITAAIDAARGDGVDAIFVVGAPDYDNRFGLSATQTATFNSPYIGPYFLVLNLKSRARAPGDVVYDRAFQAL